MKTDPTASSDEPRRAEAFPLDRRRLTLRFRAVLPSTREAISRGVEKVLDLAVSAGCVGAEAGDVEIALREALANAVIHGNGGRPGLPVRIRCYGGPGEGLLILVRDEGRGFDPAAVPDPRDGVRRELPHGRGIFLMRMLVDRVEHRKGGREVLLFKACRAPARRRGRRRRSDPE